MQLSEYLGAERGRFVRVASELKIAAAWLSQMADKKRPTPPHLVPEIERLSDYAVRRWEMRPSDWHLIWPELVGTEGAPDTPAVETRDAA